jgi:hypothetical protein
MVRNLFDSTNCGSLEPLFSDRAEPTESGPQSAVSKRQVVATIADRIRRYNSDIDSRSDTFRAAVLLLAAAEFGQNIDLLSRCTGFDRSFVARCARRLTDNGVWVSGATVADWSSADEASGTFWNDVAVAEGKMCRRTLAGNVEWAPAGFWNKNFHFTDSDSEKRLGNKYLDPMPEPAAPTQHASEMIGELRAVEPAADPGTTNDPGGAVNESDPTASSESANSPTAGKPPVPTLDRVFQDVIWIG